MEGRRFETLFVADWSEAVFLHFSVDPGALQQEVPFPLDDYEGACFVSFVAFTMRRMRFARGGLLTRWITAPIATHRFLNLRTYVRPGAGEGIFFMKEWLDNRVSIPLGPRTFGLPYHFGRLDYDHGGSTIRGEATCPGGCLRYEGEVEDTPEPAAPGTRDAFLLERYTAYTAAGRSRKRFRVWHPPWQRMELAGVRLPVNTLFRGLDEAWTKTARLVSAHFSPGVTDVWMGRPHPA